MTVKIETNSGNVERESLLQIAQEQYGQVGIKVEPLVESFPALTENTRYGKPGWEGFILGFSYGIDPDPYGIWHSSEAHATGFNRVGFKAADKLLEAQRNGPDCSQATRKKVIHDVDKLLNDEVPWTFLYAGDSLVFAQKSLQNFDPKPFSTGSLWNVEKWWFKP
jgi:peptide/nickel transport system substrate-binding protein